MKLYYHPISPYAQKVLIALYEKDIPFEREVVNLAAPEAVAAYQKIHPLGKVPLLVLEDGYKIPESTIIIEYLEGHYDQGTRLIPKGVDEARQVRFKDRMTDLYVNEPALKVLFDQIKFREYTVLDMERARKYLNIAYTMINSNLESNQWACGADFSMADCALIPCLYTLEQCLPFSDHPHIVRYWKQAQQRASYRRVQEESVPVWKGFLSAFK